ncbi:MAG: hypothetical protein QOK48_3553 [Blastocatellia bacterium]|jgi:uncharacterized membrane protein|nr:hypothetical protein [Blastocatellia bacterium]
MIREKLIEKSIGDDRKFRWRSHEISRIEGLSDAVFGFAVTLLVVSLEVPKTFNELMQAMRGFGAFAICFTLLIVVWFNQYKFFRRYGLQDTKTVILNLVLLFVVLFYVYPLKFVFTFLVAQFTGSGIAVRLPNGTVEPMVENGGQVATLMIIFGLGYLAVSALFVLLYRHAYQTRDRLQLNELEVFDTRADIRENALNAGIAALSIILAVIGGARFGALSGMTYMLTPVVMTLHGFLNGKNRRKLEERFGSRQSAELESSVGPT